ncbi:sodium-coupled monocarboxylate transporter 2-like isoform X2 [Macrobrachium nipponense]|uniref:sodium-coupled monocarboxylate transporter 2-like isoform X2 n=1 Tax=Macrobrachium nipponense TaxID=159736 RepID=UPI0030C7ABD9
MNPDPFIRHTFWSVHFIGGFNMVYLIGFNQPSYQRFASISSLSMAKRLCVWFTLSQLVIWLLIYFAGIAAYAVYSKCDPLTLGAIEKPDQILPHLVLDKLSHIPRLVGLFAGGVLSSVSSYGNSAASLLWQDFLRELDVFRGISDVNATRVVKLLSVVAGLAGTGIGVFVGQLGNIAQVAFTATNSTSGPIAGLFLSGICLPWINRKGAYAGLAVSLTFSAWLTIGQFVKGTGSPDKLPLSVEGCPESAFRIFNTSVEHVLNYTITSSSSSSPSSVSVTSLPRDRDFYSVSGNQESKTEKPVYEQEQQIERDFYHLSYCYTGTLGLLISLAVGSIVSFLTAVKKQHPNWLFCKSKRRLKDSEPAFISVSGRQG